MRAGAAPLAVDTVPPVRLRYLVVVLMLTGVVWSGVPRLRAAWQLQSAASAFANYALCMVGPTGPSLLRGNPLEFRSLVRRRLVTAGASDRPFSRCAKSVAEIASPEVASAHEATAWSFAEYGGEASDGRAPPRTLDDVAVTTHRLAELADAAWPFVRGGYTSLVQPSAYAAEAAHPPELPRGGVGRGLASPRLLLSGARVPAGEGGGAFAIARSSDLRFHVARSFSSSGVESDAVIATADARVVAAACDERALVAVVGRPGTREIALVGCAHMGECTRMPLPALGKEGTVKYPIDVARISGVTVVIAPMHGIVRVASTRDDGRSWTPFSVAYDSSAHPEVRYDVPVPDRLAVNGRRLFLFAAARTASATYPLLVSDDAGASFRAP